MKLLHFVCTLSLALGCAAAPYPFQEDARAPRSIRIGDKSAFVLDGSNCRIVIGETPPPVVRYAASELKTALDRMLGGDVAIATAPEAGKHNLFLGEAFAAASGADRAKLCRDGFFLRTVGNDCYLWGRDSASADPARNVKSGVWDQLYERGTLFAVYDFLERVGGARFFFPGDIGTVYPKQARLNVPELDLFDRPDFEARNVSTYHGEWYEGENRSRELLPARNVNYLRLRFQTETIPLAHGLSRLGLLERFGQTHPEYFAQLPDGSRHNDPKLPHPGQLCFSSGIRDEVYADLAALLTKGGAGRNLPRTAILWNYTVRPGFVDLMPQDGLAFCQCAACRAELAKGEKAYSDFLWQFPIGLGERLKADGIDGFISTMSYWPYHFIPDRKIPDNVLVMVAKHGPWGINSPMHAEDLGELKRWHAKLGRKPWLWNYANKFGNLDIADLPNVTPRAIGRYYRDVAPYAAGAFMQSNSDKFIFNYLNFYIFSKVGWDNSASVDALLDDHFRAMFGAGAAPMAELFAFLEDAWVNRVQGKVRNSTLGPVPAAATAFDIFETIYSPANLAMLDAKIAQARSLAAADPAAVARIDFMQRQLLGPVKEAAKKFAAQSNLLKQLNFHLAPVSKSDAAPALGLQPFEGKGERVRCTVRGTFDADTLTFRIDGEEPNMAGRRISADGARPWQDDSVELFLQPDRRRGLYWQFAVNTDGAAEDIRCELHDGERSHDRAATSGMRVKRQTTPEGWSLELTIPRSALGALHEPRINIVRNRQLKQDAAYVTSYSWSPALRHSYHEIENFGNLVTGLPEADRNLLGDGDFGTAPRENLIGKWFAARKPEPGQSFEWLEQGGFGGGNALKLVCKEPNNMSITQTLPQLKPETAYRLSFYMKTANVVCGVAGRSNAGGCVSLYDNANHFLPNPFIQGDTPWRRYEFELKTDKTLKTPFLRLCLMFATGEVTFSRVTLVEIP